LLGVRLLGADVGQALGGGLGRSGDLFHQASEMRFFDHVEPTAAILGRKAVRIERVADEGAIRRFVIGLQFGHGDDLIDDARQFQPRLRAFDLRLEEAAVEVIQLLVEDADEPDVLAARVLEVREPADHLLAMQAVSAARVGLSGLVAEGLRLSLAPLEAQASGDGDGIHEDRVVFCHGSGIAEAFLDRIEMRLAIWLVVAQRRIGAADEHREVAAFLPGARTHRVASPAFDGKVSGLKVEEQRFFGGSVQSSDVLPMPDLPKIQPLMPRFSASRSSAEMMGSVIAHPRSWP
jgi:hypothetical protein